MSNHFFKIFITILFGFFFVGSTNAQRRTQEAPGNQTREKGKPLINETRIDSINITTFRLDNVYSQDSFKVRGLDKYFQQYDPARSTDFDFGHLGNLGSAAYSLILDDDRAMNYSLGFNQYKLYQKSKKDILFFKQNTPFSELYFSGGETQSDLRVKTLFSRSFSNDVNWVISYDRISQNGNYTNQSVKQTSFMTSVGFKPKQSKLSLYLSYFINASSEEINGGVSDLTLFNEDGYGLRTNIPINLSDAESRLQNQNVNLNLMYSLDGDSLKNGIQTNLQYEFNYLNEFFRYSDSGVSDDSSYYGKYWLESRGVRNFAEHWNVENAFYLNNAKANLYNFKVGISQQYNRISQSSEKTNINDVFLRFKGGLSLKERLNIKADFYYGLLNAANLFKLDAKASLALSRSQGFNFEFRTGRYRSDQIENTIFLNEQLFVSNDFKKIFNQVLGAEYYNRNLRIKLGGRLSNNLNYIYFDNEGIPVQKEGLYTVSLLYVSGDFKYKSIVLENFLFFQNQSEEIVNLPQLFTKNSLSYYGKIFKKKMLLKAGLDFRYVVSQYLPSYNPVVGRFTLNTSETTVPYPLVDARISFKVASFTTFAKYENLTSFISDDINYMVLNYPQFDARFRFGILWNLWN